jgi:SAM-dependent methyltransferase
VSKKSSERIRNLTLRDPAGFLIRLDHRLFRIVHRDNAEALTLYMESGALGAMREDGRLIGFGKVDDVERNVIAATVADNNDIGMPADVNNIDLVEHPIIPFVSYPYEWSHSMLHAAGELTIEIARSSLSDGLRLKDAVADNILFNGADPIFVDALSFERRPDHEYLWAAESQFIRNFIFPLLCYRDFRMPTSTTLADGRTGPSNQSMNSLFRFGDSFRPTVFRYVLLPGLLEGWAESHTETSYQSAEVTNPDKAHFIFERMLQRLSKTIEALRPKSRKSAWTEYEKTHSYIDAAFEEKLKFVNDAAGDVTDRVILDIGCNTGRFSELLAARGARVVAIDSDPEVIDIFWQRLRQNGLNVFPMVQNIAAPSPGIGWRNREKPSFIERIKGLPNICLLLAVVHHLMVTEGIPLREIVQSIAEIGAPDIIVEFVPRDDPMFVRLTRGRDALYEEFDANTFEQAWDLLFEIISCQGLSSSGRRLYHFRLR